MQNRICLVTGASAGIGKATALGLAQQGATVVMVARSVERGQATLNEIQQATRNPNLHLLIADLASQAAIRRLAEDFQARFSALHVLINNAGVISATRQVTVDGYELQFAVNHLAYFLLTHLLLDTLKASTPARIINVSSQVHSWATLNFEDLQSEQHYEPRKVYGMTKLANVYFTMALAQRLAGTGVTVNCLHPGVIQTQLMRDYGTAMSGDTPEAGARTSIYLATSPAVEGVTGGYFVNQRQAEAAEKSQNSAIAERLWTISAQMTGLA
ncbi:MAG: SDR family oxidoreductase [Anaerolineales bacterium]|nr:SDR family oxidoreductase [Anaerolineales bacterium]